uniref:Uncharacterized protein n=1 Tax=viral metagenome TaxID=1070528 RepID=A0A6M3KYM9_9ZZZZ
MRIKQMICGLANFKTRIANKYGFVPYTTPDEPAVAFGVYHQTTIDKILHSNELTIIVWAGTDVYDFCFRPHVLDYTGITQKKNVRHVAISKWISNDLSKCGIPHICLPVNVVSIDKGKFKPVPLGTKIYCYSFALRPNLYGRAVIDAVKKKLSDIEFIDINNPTNTANLPFASDKMSEVYKQCFIGLRPTVHDGCSNTVVELGLMGRRCIHNGWLPGSIPWNRVDDIVRNIREEQKKIGSINNLLAKQTVKYIDVPDDWLYTDFWK